VKKQGYEPPIHDFSMKTHEDGEDVTEQVLSDENYTFLLVSHQLGLADDGKIDLINELYDYSLENGYTFYGVTSSSDDEILEWRENTGAEYPFCLMDNITLKTMIRSNPGLILLKEGKVIRKWSAINFPDEYQLTAPLDKLPLGYVDEASIISKMVRVVVWFVFPLFFICMVDLMFELYRKRRQKRIEKNE